MEKGLRPAVFLDRDGTINAEKEYLSRIEDFEYMPGVTEGLRELAEMGFLLVIVTNQSGIARGYYTEDDFRKLNDWMLADLESKKIKIAGVYYCPHFPEGIVPRYAVSCNCRKPLTGLFKRAQEELGIAMDRSFAVGDKMRDLAICHESGVRGVLLGKCAGKFAGKNIRECSDFYNAVKLIGAWADIPQDGA